MVPNPIYKRGSIELVIFVGGWVPNGNLVYIISPIKYKYLNYAYDLYTEWMYVKIMPLVVWSQLYSITRWDYGAKILFDTS